MIISLALLARNRSRLECGVLLRRIWIRSRSVGALPCSVLHAWMARSWVMLISSPDRGAAPCGLGCCSTPRKWLLNCRPPLPQQEAFSGAIRRSRERIGCEVPLLGEISTRAMVSTTCRFTSCALTTCWYPVYAGDSRKRYPVYAGMSGIRVSRLCGDNCLGPLPAVDETGPRAEQLHALNPHEAAAASKGGRLCNGPEVLRRDSGLGRQQNQHAFGRRVVQIRPGSLDLAQLS